MHKWDEIRNLCPKLYSNGIVFECGHGWFNLIKDLSIKIEKILEENAKRIKIPEGEEIFYFEMFAEQVKEKFGTLRFYMSTETDEITNLIHEAEAASSQTCEDCGAFAKMRGTTWIETKCDNCYKGPK